MRRIIVPLAIELSLVWAFVRPSTISSQSPGFNWGRLVVQSTSQGAEILVNGKDTNRQTNATFVVSPGDYSVSVSGKANCGGQKFHVDSGGTTTITCANGQWTQQ
jgi:hypothetical protein